MIFRHLVFAGYFPQAQQHAESAQSLISREVQFAASPTEKLGILDCAIKTQYILGKALAAGKKYPL
jgi:hypothetical protein